MNPPPLDPVAATIRAHTAGADNRDEHVARSASRTGSGKHEASGATPRESTVRFVNVSREDQTALIRQAAVQGWRDARALIAQAEADGIRELGLVAIEIIELASSDRDAELEIRSFAAEIAADSRLHPRTAVHRVNEAYEITKYFPASLESLERGAISLEHVRAIVAAAAGLSNFEKADYETLVVPLAEKCTVTQLKIQARRIAERLHPETLAERHREAVESRTVWLRDLDDGMAEVGAHLPAVLAYGVWDRLTRGARAARAAQRECRRPQADHEASQSTCPPDGQAFQPGGQASQSSESTAQASHAACPPSDGASTALQSLTADQLRADLFAELLLTGLTADSESESGTMQGRSVAGIVPRVTIVVSAHDSDASELRGYGAIDAELARSLTSVAPGWNRVAVDRSGALVATDRYRIPNRIRRLLEARDEHCRFPGCMVPISRCDIDHTIEWVNGGTTAQGNLAHLCRAHHTLKHPDLHEHSRWRVEQLPGGELRWLSPTGGIYTDRPEKPTAEAGVGPPPQTFAGEADDTSETRPEPAPF